MDWELSKENFQPLKQGRDPSKLAAKQQPVQQTNEVEEQRRAFWKEIAEYTGDDPLEVWLRFLKWTQDTFKAGGHQAELVPLLERCTRELQGAGQYKSDVRYLRLWIQYADCLPEPRDVFAFLKDNDIGQDFALYYIAYATYLELRGNFAKADVVYQAGLNRMAHPVDRLRSKFDDFQHRMAKRVQRKAQETAELGPDLVPEPGPSRSALGLIKAASSRSRRAQPLVRPAPAATAATAGPLPSLLARPKRKALLTPGKSENTSADGLDIFVDDEFQPGGAGTAPLAFGREPSAPSGLWTKLGSAEVTRKENTQQPASWVGQTLAQKKKLVPALAPALDIPVDEDLADQGSPDRDASAPEGTLRQRLDRAVKPSNLDEDLLKNPLHLHQDPRLAQSLASEQSAKPAASTSSTSHTSKRKKSEMQAYGDMHAATGGPAEVSFEESRAERWLKRNMLPMAPVPPLAAEPHQAADACEAEDMMMSPLPAKRAAEPSASATSRTQSAAQQAQQAAGPVKALHVNTSREHDSESDSQPPTAGGRAAESEVRALQAHVLFDAAAPSLHVRARHAGADVFDNEQPATAGGRAANPEMRALHAQQLFDSAAPSLHVRTSQADCDDEQPATAGGRAAESGMRAWQAQQLFSQAAPSTASALHVRTTRADSSDSQPATAGGRAAEAEVRALQAQQLFDSAAPSHAPCLHVNTTRAADIEGDDEQPPTAGGRAAESALSALKAHELLGPAPALRVRAPKPALVTDMPPTASKRGSSGMNPTFGPPPQPDDAENMPPNVAEAAPMLPDVKQLGPPTKGPDSPAMKALRKHDPCASRPALKVRTTPKATKHAKIAPEPVSPGISAHWAAEPDAGVTVSTRDAFAAINGMFSGSLPHSNSASAPEPTVTLSTKAAFAAVNGMFSSELTHQDQMQRKRSSRLSGRVEPDPNITASTQAAFAAVNNMFNTDLPQQHPLGSRNASQMLSEPTVTLSTRAALAAVNNMFHADLPHQRQPGSSKGSQLVSEPTITMSTKAAFEAINGMFSDELPHQQTRFARKPLPKSRFAPLQAQPPAPTFAAPQTPQPEPASLDMYEDTALLNRDSPRLPVKADELGIYEDTSLLAESSAEPLGNCSSPQLGAPTGQADGFAIYEDTQFVSAPFGQAPVNDTEDGPDQLGVYEDTQFVTRPLPGQAAYGNTADENALPVYEDTQFITRPVALPASTAEEGLGVYEDTQFLSQPAPAAACASTSAGALHALHPNAAQHLTPAAAAATARTASGNDQENQAPQHAGLRSLPPRSIHARDTEASVMRPLSEDRTEALRIRLSAGMTLDDVEQGAVWPAQQLAQAGAHEQDDFAVYEDTGHGEPQSSIGPVVGPFDQALQARLLQDLEPAVQQWDDVSTVTNSEATTALETLRRIKCGPRGKQVMLSLGSAAFQVQRCIGQGAFASVYEASLHSGDSSPAAPSALKVQSPACAWEFYICRALQGRASPSLTGCFMHATRLFLGPGMSVLEARCERCGTLQDVINGYLKVGKRMDEVVAMYYTMELLRTVAELHRCQILHTDLKPDNLLMRNDGSLTPLHAAGLDAWRTRRGLILCDFGRAVDLALLPEGTTFLGDSMTEAFRCIEMQEQRPWTYGVDAYGICAVAHCMLFGDYMHVVKAVDPSGGAHYRMRSALKRYWAVDLWEGLFDTLLNAGNGAVEPLCHRLLAQFEAHMSAQPGLLRKLHSELVKQEITIQS